MIIIDADTFIYKAASLASNEKEARDALHSLVESVIHINANRVGICVFTRTSSFKSGRFEVKATLPYQHSRPDAKPPLVLYLKDYVITKYFKEACPANMRCVIATNYEADDVCVMLGNQYPHSTIYCEDKDLFVVSNTLLTSRQLYDKLSADKPLGYLELKDNKLTGRGKLFFWSQMLMGDTADGVRGLSHMIKDEKRSLCGPVRAYNELIPYVETQDENALANHVISLYRDINQNIIPEGWLLWLMPKIKMNFIDYLFTLDIKEHMDWIFEQLNLEWYNTPKIFEL